MDRFTEVDTLTHFVVAHNVPPLLSTPVTRVPFTNTLAHPFELLAVLPLKEQETTGLGSRVTVREVNNTHFKRTK